MGIDIPAGQQWVSQTVQWVGTAIEFTGTLAIVIGTAISGLRYIRDLLTRTPDSYKNLRTRLGRAILLGLELLVAADILRTVAFEPTLQRAVVLALIVLIRTFLSFSLEVEINGNLPWRNRERELLGATGASVEHRAPPQQIT